MTALRLGLFILFSANSAVADKPAQCERASFFSAECSDSYASCEGNAGFFCYHAHPDTGEERMDLLREDCMRETMAECAAKFMTASPGPESEEDELIGDNASVGPEEKRKRELAEASPSPGGADTGDAGESAAFRAQASKCRSARSGAALTCNVDQAADRAAPLLQMLQQQKNANDMLAACQTAARVQQITSGINLTFGAFCGQRARSCVNECTSALNRGDDVLTAARDRSFDEMMSDTRENRIYCEQKGQMANDTAMQGMAFAQSFLQSKICADTAKAFPCMDTAKAVDNPQCAEQYCMKDPQGRKNEKVCAALFGNCKDPQVAASSPACICERDPNNGLCRQYPSTADALGGNRGTGGFASVPGISTGSDGLGETSLKEMLDSGDMPDLEYSGGSGSKSQRSVTATEQPSNGGGFGSGSGGTGGGSGSAASRGGGRPAGSGYKTDIMTGTSGGGGGGSPYGFGAGSQENPYGKLGASARANLADYLPGGARDPRRLPAGVSQKMFDAGVTSANGLSNFEKVTRKMHEKRTWLLPGD